MSHRPDIVDVSHLDTITSFHAIKDAGVVGVICKATQGSGFTDPAFSGYIKRARVCDLAVGAYCFLDGSDFKKQIDHFLAATPDVPFRVLDYERNKGSQCSLKNAIDATHYLADKQGRLPVIYGSDLLVEAVHAGRFYPGCDLWVARYGATPAIPWKLHQYVAGESGDGRLAGVAGSFDLNTFNGTQDECRAWMEGK